MATERDALESRTNEAGVARFDEELLEGIAELSQQGYARLDLEGRVQRVSDRMLAIVGRDPGHRTRVLGRHASHFLAPLAQPQAHGDALALAAERPLALEWDLSRADGEVARVLCHGHPLRDARGTPVGIAVLVQDVTLQRWRERELADQNRLLALLREHLPLVIFELDAQLVFRRSAGAGLQRLGLAAGDVVGLRLHDTFPDQLEAVREAIRIGVPSSVEVNGEGPDGPWAFLLHVLPDGKGGCFAVALDTTERTQALAEAAELEARLLQAQRLDSLGNLAGGIAHDFNNLVGVILVLAENALGDVPEDTALGGDLREIVRAARKGREQVRRLLTFSRRVEPRREQADLGALLGETVTMLGRTLPKNVRIELQTSKNLGLVPVDPAQLDQVVVNLVANARDAMPEGGRIAIETRAVTLEVGLGPEGVPPGDYALLRVGDTGEGMPQEVLERAFEPFYTTKPMGSGTGLGLSTVFGIARAHGGYVQCRSEVGVGTTIDLLLPVEENSGLFPSLTVRSPEAELPGTVLVADDERLFVTSVARYLERRGVKVLKAFGGAEAIEAVEEHAGEIDAVILDVGMPDMTGPTCLARMRVREPGLPALLVTGYTQREEELRELAPVLPKPFTFPELERELRQLGRVPTSPGSYRAVAP
ncbi:MAG: ATP-binding protein [Myxococcota bacterium]